MITPCHGLVAMSKLSSRSGRHVPPVSSSIRRRSDAMPSGPRCSPEGRCRAARSTPPPERRTWRAPRDPQRGTRGRSARQGPRASSRPSRAFSTPSPASGRWFFPKRVLRPPGPSRRRSQERASSTPTSSARTFRSSSSASTVSHSPTSTPRSARRSRGRCSTRSASSTRPRTPTSTAASTCWPSGRPSVDTVLPPSVVDGLRLVPLHAAGLRRKTPGPCSGTERLRLRAGSRSLSHFQQIATRAGGSPGRRPAGWPRGRRSVRACHKVDPAGHTSTTFSPRVRCWMTARPVRLIVAFPLFRLSATGA
jgi:hypothetical protein